MPKKTFSLILLILTVSLMFLPLITSLSGFLTTAFLNIGWYRAIEEFILPFETRLIVFFIHGLGMDAIAGRSTVSVMQNGAWHKIMISWNCIGWQSIIIFLLTLATGLNGTYSLSSKLEAFILGFLGTFWVNIFRVTFITLLIIFINAIPAAVLHDYLSAFILILWLIFFWWFVYAYVLEEKNSRA